MTRARAEQLLDLLAELESAGGTALPPEYRRSVEYVKALALVELTFDDDNHSRKVPALRLVL